MGYYAELMQHAIIETKLAPPKYSGRLVRRQKLLNRLGAGAKKQVTVVIGPAGYGKTNLVTLWRQDLIARGHDIAWFGLSPEDDDLRQFVFYLAASINEAAPGIGVEAIKLFDRDRTDATEAFIAALVNDIQHYRRAIYLILDDYHLVKSEAVHQLLDRLIRTAPPNFHLVITSRTCPPLALARLRAHDQVTEIDFAELRLTFEEAAEFIRLRGLELEGRALRVVYELTDGWIAGLQLACIALKRNPDLKHFETTRLNQVNQFSDYLDAEVLSLLSAEEMDFLVRISSCGKFNAGLCARLTGNKKAADILAKAENENLFLVPLETQDDRQWFRFHPLMSQFLRRCLKRLPAAEIKAMNKNACEWLLGHGLAADAVHHAIQAEDFEQAASLVERCGRQLVLDGRLKTLLSWGMRIPESIGERRARMWLPIIWALLLCSRTNQARKLMERVAAHKEQLTRDARAEILLQEATLEIMKDDTVGMLRSVEGYAYSGDDPFLIIAPENIRSVGYCYAGEYEKARDIQLGARWAGDYHTGLMRRLFGDCFVGLSFALQGDMTQAERTYREALMAAEQQEGFYSDPACIAVSYLSEVLYETGCWDEGRKLISERLDTIDRVATPDGLVRSYIALSRIAWFRGQRDEARAHLETLEDMGLKSGLDRLVAYALRDDVRIELQENNLTWVEELLRRLDTLARKYAGAERCAHAEIPVLAEQAKIAYLRAQGHWEEALEGIRRLIRVMESWRRFRELAQLKLLAAMTLDKQGKSGEAVDLAEQCLDMCQRLGLVRTVLDEGDDAKKLVFKVAAKDNLDPILDAYIRALSWNIEQAKAGSETRGVSALDPLVEPLSEREMEVLRLLAQSLTNKKVALSLGVSPETVKWHLKNIFAKLSVTTRDEAVARGRDLNFIGPR